MTSDNKVNTCETPRRFTSTVSVIECPKYKKKGTIIIDIVSYTKVKAMMKEMGSKEWLAYLIGTFPEDISKDPVLITGLMIPEQEVSSTSVDVVGEPPAECIGTIHSHHSMGAFASGTDKDHLQGNHNVFLVVTTKLDFEAKIRTLLPCGDFCLQEAELQYSLPQSSEVEEFVASAKGVIKEKTYAYQQYLNNGNYGRWDGNKWIRHEGPVWESKVENKSEKTESKNMNDNGNKDPVKFSTVKDDTKKDEDEEKEYVIVCPKCEKSADLAMLSTYSYGDMQNSSPEDERELLQIECEACKTIFNIVVPGYISESLLKGEKESKDIHKESAKYLLLPKDREKDPYYPSDEIAVYP
jgi:hypothetical protein